MTKVYLKDQSGHSVEATLHRDVAYAQIAQTDRQWTTVKRSLRIASVGAGERMPESHEWDWPQKYLDRAVDHRFYAIEWNGIFEGLMQITITPRPSERPECEGRSTIYVDHLETAPWNQRLYSSGGAGKFRGVGYNLLAAAAEDSIALGCEERLSLHSLPDSERFYRDMKVDGISRFIDLGTGFAPYSDLRFFESRSFQEWPGGK